MRVALDEARCAAAEGEVPVGAVIVRDGIILARGRNRCEARGDATQHAEMVVLRRAMRRSGYQRLPGATLYCSLEPCVMCAGAIVLARIQRLVFGARDPKFGGVRSLGEILALPGLNHRVQVSEGILAQSARDLMREFFSGLRNGHCVEDSAASLDRGGG